ncbi:hypothetical protein ACHAWX_002089 [Stephanocyclus meneghinianus]
MPSFNPITLGHMVFKTLKNLFSRPQHMKVTRWSTLIIFASSSVFAFILGCATRIRLQLIPDQKLLRAHVELDLKNATSQLIDLRNEASRNQILIQKQPIAASNLPQACHEALVHPGMVSHPHPKRVGIVGCGAGVLREVLKHSTTHAVKVFAVDDDESIISSSFDEPRVDVGHVDSLLQTSISLGKNPTTNNVMTFQDNVFDIIFVQNYPKEFVLSTDASFFRASYNALSNNGLLVLPLGALLNEDGKLRSKNRVTLIHQLEGLGFTSIHIYEDGNCKFVEPRSVLVAFKEYKTRSNWYRNAAEIQVQLHKRLLNTRSTQSPLVYFDSATMLNYQVPSKASEKHYCRDYQDEDCDYRFGSLPADTVNIPVSHFEIRKSSVSDTAGRGVFAVQDIPRHACIALELSVKNFCVMPYTWTVIDSIYSRRKEKKSISIKSFEGLVYYILGYGYGSQLLGETHWTVDSSMLLFSNHGCNGTFNYGTESIMLSELSVDINEIPEGLDGSKAVAYSPFQERHLRSYSGTGDYTLRDIKAGEEILTNYIAFVDPSDWRQEILILRSQCAGEKVGEITDYESGEKSYY